MGKEFEEEVIQGLRKIIKLLAISSLGDETQIKKISKLKGVGFSSKDIADILETTTNTISVALNKLKNKDKLKEEFKNKNSGVIEGSEEINNKQDEDTIMNPREEFSNG